ncbi:MAG: cytochrome c [Proteobacteria bacterium]|nr:cytochrome c [Pseudomonadota bacterium]
MIFKKTWSAFAIVACFSVATSALADTVLAPMSCDDIMNRAEVKASVESKLPVGANGQQPSIKNCKQHQNGLAIAFKNGGQAFVKVLPAKDGTVTVEVIKKSAPDLQRGAHVFNSDCRECHGQHGFGPHPDGPGNY